MIFQISFIYKHIISKVKYEFKNNYKSHLKSILFLKKIIRPLLYNINSQLMYRIVNSLLSSTSRNVKQTNGGLR